MNKKPFRHLWLCCQHLYLFLLCISQKLWISSCDTAPKVKTGIYARVHAQRMQKPGLCCRIPFMLTMHVDSGSKPVCVYLMCVAGRDSYWRDRKSSLCRSWCFCFSLSSGSVGVSFSSSKSSALTHTNTYKHTHKEHQKKPSAARDIQKIHQKCSTHPYTKHNILRLTTTQV